MPSMIYGVKYSYSKDIFTKQERLNFKNKQITKVEISNDSYKTIHYINKDGNIDSTEIFDITKKKKRRTVIRKYLYNNRGLMTSLFTETKYDITYDSLSYDSIDRIIYHYESFKDKSKKGQQWSFEMTHISSNDHSVTLGLQNSVDSSYIILDNKNNLIKNVSINQRDNTIRIDSVYNNQIDDSNHTKLVYFKYENDSVFQLGEELHLKNDLLLKSVNYKITAGKTFGFIDRIYSYDKNNQLLRISSTTSPTPLKFYTYYTDKTNTPGLIKKEISISDSFTEVLNYKYF
jgi:hypothetical protein